MPEIPGRDEQILQAIINGTEYTQIPQSRIEYLLLQLKAVIEGGGGVSDYTELENKPSINNVTLVGNKSLSDLGIVNPMMIKGRVNSVSDLPQVAEPGWVYFVGRSDDADLREYVYTLDSEWEFLGYLSIIIDSALSTTSENPVQNKVITAALNSKIGMEDVYGRGIQIPNGTDLHDITTPGSYYCGTAADAATLLNCPVSTGFRLVVTSTVSPWDVPERVRHDLYPTGSRSSAVYSENLGSVTSYYPDGWRNWGVVYNIIDAVPTSGSQYAVSSDGVYAALENKLDISEIDDEIDPSSTNPVQNDVISAALTSTKESVLSELYLGITLSTGTDFNTLLTPGVYRIVSGSAAQTMVNCPSTAAGRLEVIYLWAPNRYLQRYYLSGARFYMRAYSGNGWGHWFEYAGVDTSPQA